MKYKSDFKRTHSASSYSSILEFDFWFFVCCNVRYAPLHVGSIPIITNANNDSSFISYIKQYYTVISDTCQ